MREEERGLERMKVENDLFNEMQKEQEPYEEKCSKIKKKPEAPEIEHGRDALSREILEDYRKIKGYAPDAFKLFIKAFEAFGKFGLFLFFLFLLFIFVLLADFSWLFEMISS